MQGKPGDKTIYEYKDKNNLATIINTYDNDNKATLSLLGTEDIIKTDNDFEDIIEPGGGSETFAFIHALVSDTNTATATDGITTLVESGNSDIVFAIPNSGSWTVSCNDIDIQVDVSDYGVSYNADFLPIEIIQPSFGDSVADYQWTSNSLTITYDYPSNALGGIVFNTKGKNFSLSYTGGLQQHGYCLKSATLPSIISSGAGRVSYSTINPANYNYDSNYYNFIGVQNGVSIGQTITITITLTS